MAELVHYEVHDRIARVTIDNGKANVLSPACIAAIDDAVSRAEAAPAEEVGAVLLTGRPGMLSGGFDLAVMQSGPEAAGDMVTAGGALVAHLFGASVPVVIACGGHAIAAGALLLLAASERIGAAGTFKIGLTETQLGMVLPRWAAEIAEERLSRRYLAVATLGARVFDPEGARDAGYLDEVVAPDRLEAVALERAATWAGLPRRTYAGQVQLMRGERLRRLAEAVAGDRGRAFTIETP